MFKREIKQNRKSLIIWTTIIVFLFILVFAIYPSIIEKNKEINELIQMFPKEFLAAFNMDTISISHVSGWLLTEGYLFINLLGSCFFAILGGTILLKEQNDHTIDFLYTKPIPKNKIVTSKLLAGITYILIFNTAISITTWLGMTISNDFNFKYWILLSLLPILVHLFFLTFSMLTSNYFRKNQKSITLNLGIVLGTYLLGILANLSDKLEFLKYLSPFQYIDSKMIVDTFHPWKLVLLSSIIVIILIGLYDSYKKKEFI